MCRHAPRVWEFCAGKVFEKDGFLFEKNGDVPVPNVGRTPSSPRSWRAWRESGSETSPFNYGGLYKDASCLVQWMISNSEYLDLEVKRLVVPKGYSRTMDSLLASDNLHVVHGLHEYSYDNPTSPIAILYTFVQIRVIIISVDF